MKREVYILEYYEEIDKDGLHDDKYSLLGVFKTKKEAYEKKRYIINKYGLIEDTLYVSLSDIGISQWEGGFVSV